MTPQPNQAAGAVKPAAQPVAQWQKRGRGTSWENTNEGDAKWWASNSPGWECRALYAATPPVAGDKPSINYETLFEFAELHRVNYNQLCTAVRSALTPSSKQEGGL